MTTTAHPRIPPEQTENEVVHRLARVAARCCSSPTLVVAADAAPFEASLQHRPVPFRSVLPEAALADSSVAAPCILLVLTGADPPHRLIDALGSRLPVDGRIIVAAPNRDAESGYSSASLRERDLRRLLQVFGRPVVVGEQPFAWLLMHVDRKQPRGNEPSRSTHERYETMAALCRGSVVELGCGAGVLAAAINAAGHDVVGVDLNGPKIELARSRYPDIEFIQADVCRQDLLIGRRFDTVVLAEVLEHVTDATGEEMLATAARLLAPGGRIIVSVPNRNCIPHRNHIRAFERASLKAMLSRFGHPRTVTSQPYKWLLMYADGRA